MKRSGLALGLSLAAFVLLNVAVVLRKPLGPAGVEGFLLIVGLVSAVSAVAAWTRRSEDHARAAMTVAGLSWTAVLVMWYCSG